VIAALLNAKALQIAWTLEREELHMNAENKYETATFALG